MATDKKRVQAFLSNSLHELLSEYASGKGLSLSAAIAEILGKYFCDDSPSVNQGEVLLHLDSLVEADLSEEFFKLKNEVRILKQKVDGLLLSESHSELLNESDSELLNSRIFKTLHSR